MVLLIIQRLPNKRNVQNISSKVFEATETIDVPTVGLHLLQRNATIFMLKLGKREQDVNNRHIRRLKYNHSVYLAPVFLRPPETTGRPLCGFIDASAAGDFERRMGAIIAPRN